MIQGNKIRLRAMEPEDIDTLYDMENDLQHWDVSDTQMPFSRYTMEQYVLSCDNQDIYSLKQVRLMICEKGSGMAVGCIDLYDYQPQHQRAAVGIMVSEKHQQQGYASEALGLLCRYAREILHLHQLYCHVSASNRQSLHLFESHGFIRTAVLKEWRQSVDGRWEDTLLLQNILTKA